MPEYPLPSFEEVIFQAVVQKFFEPEQKGTTSIQSGWNSQTNQPNYSYAPVYDESPLSFVVRKMYGENAQKIADAIFEKIDLSDFGKAIADRIVNELFQTNSYGGVIQTEAFKKIRAVADERVAQALTEETLSRMRNEAASNETPKNTAPVHAGHGPGGYDECCSACEPNE